MNSRICSAVSFVTQRFVTMNFNSKEKRPATIGLTDLNDYELLHRIGAGSCGDVWLARDAVDKHVAVKVIDRERLVLMSQKNREERALRLMRTELPEHEHLIRIHHVGNDAARPGSKLHLVLRPLEPAG